MELPLPYNDIYGNVLELKLAVSVNSRSVVSCVTPFYCDFDKRLRARNQDFMWGGGGRGGC